MMVDPETVGAGASEGQGDAAAEAAAAAAAEASSGDAAGEGEARDTEKTERERYLADVKAQADRIEAAAARIASAGPTAPAATPPTASRSEVAEFEAEGRAIATERARLDAAMRADGLTAQHLYDHGNLVARESRFNAQLVATGFRIGEQERAADKRARVIEKAGSEEAWQKFADEHPGVPPDILRDAFDKRQEKAGAPKPKPKAASEATPRADVSGGREVSATEKRARTITEAQWDTRQKELIASKNFKALREESEAIRTGATILK